MRKFIPLLLLLTVPAWGVRATVASRHHRVQAVLHILHHRRKPEYRVFPPSHVSLIMQNQLAGRLGLLRFYDDDELGAAVDRGDMVPIIENEYVKIAKTLPADRRLVRPWVNDWLQDKGKRFYEEFHQPIQVNSAVRTYLVQKKLRRRNRNAAPVDGESASSHMYGATVDLQRRGLTKRQIRFMEMMLLQDYARGWVLEEEELRQPCFHTMVSGDYGKPVETETPDLGIELIPVLE